MINSKKGMAYLQIFLVVSFSFAAAVLIGAELGVGQLEEITDFELATSQLTGDVAGMGSAAPAITSAAGAVNPCASGMCPWSSTGILTGINDEGSYFMTTSTGTETFSTAGELETALTGEGVSPEKAAVLAENPAGPAGGGTAAGTGFKGLLSGTAFGQGAGFGGAISSLTSGLIWGAMVGFGAYFIAGFLGQNKNQAKSIGMSAGLGVFAGTTAMFLGNNGILFTAKTLGLGITPGLWGLGIGIGVGVGVLLATYKKEKKTLITFECNAWEPPVGGRDCEKCNEDALMPCSEYRCRSLGQACEIVNAGEENEMCVWINPGDVNAPTITPWDEALKPDGLRYTKHDTLPPSRGTKISKIGAAKGCLQAWTKLEFGVLTNEPAKCKIDYAHTEKFDDMGYLFGGTTSLTYEHTQRLKVPNPFETSGNDSDVPAIDDDGTYTLYVRCMDANGNGEDSAEFAFSFCVDKGPDTSEPTIVGSSITDGSPVRYNADKVPIEIYVDEPAECRWSKEDKSFEIMENMMKCSTASYQINSNLDYVCSGDLTGIVNRADNKFYFRCKDFSTEQRNVMSTSYPLTLRGTEELVINKVGPNATIEGGASVIPVNLTVETGHGANDGEAICYFTADSAYKDVVEMGNSRSWAHSQTLYLEEGSYTYYIQCVDAGGNAAYTSTTFNVKVNDQIPIVARVYKDGENLKVVTDIDAKCAYSTTSCNYNLEEGIVMSYVSANDKTSHTTDWAGDVTFYIKCENLQGFQPRGDACSIVAKASEL